MTLKITPLTPLHSILPLFCIKASRERSQLCHLQPVGSSWSPSPHPQNTSRVLTKVVHKAAETNPPVPAPELSWLPPESSGRSPRLHSSLDHMIFTDFIGPGLGGPLATHLPKRSPQTPMTSSILKNTAGWLWKEPLLGKPAPRWRWRQGHLLFAF